MKRITLALALVAGVVWLGASAPAQATDEQPPPNACYEQVAYPVYQYKQTTTTPAVEEVSHVEYRWDIQTRERIVEEIIQKQTRTLEAGTKDVPSKWWVWAPNDTKGPQDYVPNFPSDERGKWVGPKTDGGPSQDTYGTFQQGGGNSSWFHRSEPIPGTDPTWSQWTFWGSPSLVDDGRDRGPLPHNNKTPGTVGYREYRYIVVGTQLVGFTEWVTVGQTDWSLSDAKPSNTELRQYVNLQQRTVVDVEYVPESTVTVFYNDGNVSSDDLAVEGVREYWTTDETLDRSWEKIASTTFYRNGNRIPCSDEPRPRFETKDVREPCTSAGQTVTDVANYERMSTWTYDYATETWVETWGDWELLYTNTSDLTEEELAECPQPPTTTEPPVTTEPPATLPPVTTQPPIVCIDTFENDGISGCSEAPVTTPTTAPPALATELPATGSPLTGILLALAGGLTLAGAGTLVARRR